DALREAYGLNDPLPVQLVTYLKHIVRGDLGDSYSYNKPVTDVILSRLGATLLLIVTSQLLGLLVGTALGTMAARYYPSRWDSIVSFCSLAGYSMPVFWL